MSLPAVAGATLYASDLYQLCQPSGGQEKGKYFLQGWASASGDALCCYLPSQSRGATPVSVSIDTADQAPSFVNTPLTDSLTSSGFRVKATASGAAASAVAGGNYTIQY